MLMLVMLGIICTWLREVQPPFHSLGCIASGLQANPLPGIFLWRRWNYRLRLNFSTRICLVKVPPVFPWKPCDIWGFIITHHKRSRHEAEMDGGERNMAGLCWIVRNNGWWIFSNMTGESFQTWLVNLFKHLTSSHHPRISPQVFH